MPHAKNEQYICTTLSTDRIKRISEVQDGWMDGRTERMVCVWVYATDCYEHKQETEITGRVMVLVCVLLVSCWQHCFVKNYKTQSGWKKQTLNIHTIAGKSQHGLTWIDTNTYTHILPLVHHEASGEVEEEEVSISVWRLVGAKFAWIIYNENWRRNPEIPPQIKRISNSLPGKDLTKALHHTLPYNINYLNVDLQRILEATDGQSMSNPYSCNDDL